MTGEKQSFDHWPWARWCPSPTVGGGVEPETEVAMYWELRTDHQCSEL